MCGSVRDAVELLVSVASELTLSSSCTTQAAAILTASVDLSVPSWNVACCKQLYDCGFCRYLQGPAHGLPTDKHDDEAPAAADSSKQKSAADLAQVAAGSHVTPQALAVQLICRCDEIPDEGVEVLVLRGLLTASTSLTFTLHGQALLLAVRTCYNIHLMSRSEVNQTTAKAALTQMLNVVFQRMEAGSVKIAVSGPAVQ